MNYRKILKSKRKKLYRLRKNAAQVSTKVLCFSHAKRQANLAELFRFLKFLGFSISAGVIQIVSFEILYEAIHLIWWPSYLISIILSVIWNFTFNRKFTFQSANNVAIAMGWSLAFYVAFVPLSVFGGGALENAGWNGTLVTFLMMVINFVTEFLWQRYFVFRKSIGTRPLVKKKKKLAPIAKVANKNLALPSKKDFKFNSKK